MGTAAISTTIENTFETAWGVTTPISFDNVDFSQPSTSWISLEIWDGKSNKKSLGINAQLRRSLGTVFLMVYTPLNGGSGPARVLVDQVKNIFRDLVVDGVTFYEGDVKRIGEKYSSKGVTEVSATAQWYQMVVAIPFKYDEYI